MKKSRHHQFYMEKPHFYNPQKLLIWEFMKPQIKEKQPRHFFSAEIVAIYEFSWRKKTVGGDKWRDNRMLFFMHVTRNPETEE